MKITHTIRALSLAKDASADIIIEVSTYTFESSNRQSQLRLAASITADYGNHSAELWALTATKLDKDAVKLILANFETWLSNVNDLPKTLEKMLRLALEGDLLV